MFVWMRVSVWLKQYICTLLIICYIPRALNHSFASFRCAYHIANDKNGLLLFVLPDFKIYRYWLYGYMTLYQYDMVVSHARAFISMECLVIKTPSICRLCYYIFCIPSHSPSLFSGFLFFAFSLSLVLSAAEKFLHQTYKCQVQPIWWADISHWYFIIVLNLHIIFPFFMIYTINISFILSFVFHILMVFTIFISSFYFRFAAFRLFITCAHRWRKKKVFATCKQMLSFVFVAVYRRFVVCFL